jgi:hypothetical protein
MRKNVLLLLCALMVSTSFVFAQGYTRLKVEVPKVDPAAITIDGKMDEAVWNAAAHADMITNNGFHIYTNKYYRESLVEPDYEEMYGRILWAQDTLYVFMHIKELVNDSTDLFWKGKWTGDQLLIGLSDRLGIDMKRWYDGNVYAAPDGPYHFLVLGNKVTLNNGDTTNVPEEFQGSPADSQKTFDASTIARWATTINKATGLWDVEMAIYNPGVGADAHLGFNIGGSTGSTVSDSVNGDAYAYYTWEPCVIDSPYAQPSGVEVPSWGGDPGFYTLATSQYWPILHFVPDQADYKKLIVDVPKVDPASITIDGKMNESAWGKAAHADMITNSGFNIYTNKYYRESLVEPDYEEMYGRMLWAQDTLYVFMHIKELVNDSTDLFWKGKWTGDQLLIGLSDRIGLDMKRWYDGNVYAAPDGPYHFLVLGDKVTLNNGDTTNVADEFRRFPTDTARVFDASTIARWATTINKATGLWDVEMAVYNPGVGAEGRIGFNIGGSTGSTVSDSVNGDAYAYYTWQPCVPDSPYAQPSGVEVPSWGGDPGFYTLATSQYWPVLNFVDKTSLSVEERSNGGLLPAMYTLSQNYPNPFNPSTTIDYSLPHASRVKLNIYNVLGQVVATLVNDQRAAGTYAVRWNASNLASGLYFYQLTADGNTIATKKMLLVK